MSKTDRLLDEMYDNEKLRQSRISSGGGKSIGRYGVEEDSRIIERGHQHKLQKSGRSGLDQESEWGQRASYEWAFENHLVDRNAQALFICAECKKRREWGAFYKNIIRQALRNDKDPLCCVCLGKLGQIQCRACGELKPRRDFPVEKRNKSNRMRGHSGICYPCEARQRQEQRKQKGITKRVRIPVHKDENFNELGCA